MPTIHREAGLRFCVYVADHPPPHVHVIGDGETRIEIATSVVLSSSHRRIATVWEAQRIVERERAKLMAAWEAIHEGNQ